MLNFKEARGKVGGRAPPTVTANKAPLNTELLMIHTKAQEEDYLFSLQNTPLTHS